MVAFVCVCGITRHFMLQSRKAVRHFGKLEEKLHHRHLRNLRGAKTWELEFYSPLPHIGDSEEAKNSELKEPIKHRISVDFGE